MNDINFYPGQKIEYENEEYIIRDVYFIKDKWIIVTEEGKEIDARKL